MPGSCMRRGGRLVVLWALLTGGCQTYEARPLDLDGHRAAFDHRLDDVEPVRAFAERLAGSGTGVPEAFDWSDGLTLTEGEIVALFYNDALRLARLRAGVALATWQTAGLWEDPEFGFDGAELISPSGPFEFGLTLSLTIPISGRLEIEKQRAGAAYEAELRKLVHREWGTRAAVRRAWAAWSIAAERITLLEAQLASVDDIRHITQRLEEVGEIGRVDARLFAIEDSIRRTELIASQAEERRARIRLHELLGLPASADAHLVPAFGMPLPLRDTDLDQALIRRNTWLAVRRAEYQVAEETLRLEVRKQYPDITIGGGYGSEDDDRLLLGVSIPVPILNANRQEIAIARTERDLSRAEAETAYERLSHDLALAVTDLDAAAAQRSNLERSVIPLADLQFEEVQRLADLGDFNSLLLLQSVDQQLRAKLRLLGLKMDETDAAVRLAELIGPADAAAPAPVTATHSENESHDDAQGRQDS